MALEPQSSGFAELRAEVLQYCCENNVTFPHTDYPFDWPECIERPASPFPEIADCFASSISLPDETPRDEETFKQYLDQILKVSEAKRDIYDIRQLTRYKLEEPLLLRQAGSNAFRKFGPDTLQKCAASISSLQLNDENGLKITKDKGQISKTLEKDSKLTVTEEHTNFLKKVIEDYNSRSFPDIILAKPPSTDISISPPLLPYNPPQPTDNLPKLSELHSPSVPVPKFHQEVFLSSPFSWDELSSSAEEYLNGITKPPIPQSTPSRVVQTRSNCVEKWRMEPPLTPISIKKSPQPYEEKPFSALQPVTSFPSPKSPDIQRAIHLLKEAIFKETVTEESSHRIAIPDLPPPSPVLSMFPTSMRGIYIADDDYRCDAIPRSVIDSLNDEMKWQPIKGGKRNLDMWPEEPDGDWEEFVDYTGYVKDQEMVVLRRMTRIDVDEEPDEIHVGSPDLTSTNIADDVGNQVAFSDLMGLVRKRKRTGDEIRKCHTKLERSEWSQRKRIIQYMDSRGITVSHAEEEEVFGKVLRPQVHQKWSTEEENLKLLNINSGEEDCTKNNEIIAPSIGDIERAAQVIFISMTTLSHHLIIGLQKQLPNAIFLERDLTEPYNDIVPEGDIILSPNRCILHFTLAQVNQSLPSLASIRILQVASKYRQIILLISGPSQFKGRDIAMFCGWLEQIRRDHDIQMICVRGVEEALRWCVWGCGPRKDDGDLIDPKCLTEEETDDELLLRKTFNVFAAQVILGRTTLADFMELSQEERSQRYHDIASQRILTTFSHFMSELAG